MKTAFRKYTDAALAGLLVVSVMLMTGCASVDSGATSILKTLVELNRPLISSHDSSNAMWVRDAKATVSLRTPMFFAQSEVARDLVRACKAGKWAEVIVYVGGAREVGALRGTCVKVYVSDNPDLSRGFDILLLDGDTVYTEGRMVAVVNRTSQQEYFYRQSLKKTARQFN